MASSELEPILAVEKELDRVINKFTEIKEMAEAEINDVATLLEELMQVLGKAEQEMTGTINTGTQVDTDDPMADEAEMQVEMERRFFEGKDFFIVFKKIKVHYSFSSPFDG